MKIPNKEQPTVLSEESEGRSLAGENPDQPTVTGTQSPEPASSGLTRIRALASKDRKVRFTNLLHHVTPALLRDSYEALKRSAAPGVDGITWDCYGEDLQRRLAALHERIHSGRYRATPSRRVWIPKGDGRMRPLGIAALEDKIIQLAVVWILNQIYEVNFAGFSYGFRPRRSQHQALDAIWLGIAYRSVSWVLDADIRGFFDHVDHTWLMKFVEHRVADLRLLRLIQKWLKAGVVEDGKWKETHRGTPQGAVISPILANIYLHYVLDLWVKWWRRTQAKGEAIIVRYADDFVMGFQHHADADKFLHAVGERMAKFGLELHPEKTRLIQFGRFAKERRARAGESKPETFDFLGFTHYCAQRRSDGTFTIGRKTVAERLRAKAKQVGRDLMRNRHDDIARQGRWLRAVVQGFFNYHAIPGNQRALYAFRKTVRTSWRRALRRRSQRSHVTYEWIDRMADRWLPKPQVLHPYPSQRMRVIITSKSRMR